MRACWSTAARRSSPGPDASPAAGRTRRSPKISRRRRPLARCRPAGRRRAGLDERRVDTNGLDAAVLLAAALSLAGVQQQPVRRRAPRPRTRCSIAFDERSPRYLDPTASYSNPESAYTYQVYEPLYGYHYLKRPYELMPKSAAEVRRAVLPRQERAARCPTTRPASRSPKASTTSRSAAASCTRRTRPSPRTRKGNYLYHRLKPRRARRQALAAATSSSRARASWWPRTSSTRSSATPRRASRRRSSAVFSEYVLGLKDYGETVKAEDAKLLRRPARRRPRQALPRLPPVAAGGRRGARTAPAAHPHQGQVPAVEVLDGDDLHGARAVGGRRLLRPAGHGRQRAVAEPVAGRHRAVHDDRVHPRPAPRAGAQPATTAASPTRAKASRATARPACSPTAASACPSSTSSSSPIEKEKVPRKAKFKQGYLDVPGDRAPRLGRRLPATTPTTPTRCGAASRSAASSSR